MELGPVFAILSAALVAIAYVLIRRATHHSDESFTALSVSLLVGTPVFFIILLISGEWSCLFSFTWQQYALLGAAGWLHYLISRYLYFSSVRLIGANPTAAIIRTSAIFSVLLGVIWLDEAVTVWQIIGAAIIMFGAILSSIEVSHNTMHLSVRGLMLGLGSSLGVSGSAALTRMVMVTTDAVYAATFTAYLSSFVVIVVILLFSHQRYRQIRQESGRNLIFLSITAVILVVSHLFRFLSFEYSPISVAQPLMGTVVFFVLLYSVILNRRIDVFYWRVIFGIVLVLAGVYLISG